MFILVKNNPVCYSANNLLHHLVYIFLIIRYHIIHPTCALYGVTLCVVLAIAIMRRDASEIANEILRAIANAMPLRFLSLAISLAMPRCCIHRQITDIGGIVAPCRLPLLTNTP